MKCSLFALCVASAALSACGGGGDSAPSSPATASHAFVAPAAGTTAIYAESLNDNLNNTINRTIIENVTSIRADGGFTISAYDPSHHGATLGTINYTFFPTDNDYDSAGQVQKRVVLYPDGTSSTCVYAQNPSTSVDKSIWNFTYSETCDRSSPITFSQSGSYLGTESVTVPAGTFIADKYQNTITWIDPAAAGATITETMTSWRNSASTDSTQIKFVKNFAYSPAARPNSLVSLTRALQSRQ